jgi:hypothetical protein
MGRLTLAVCGVLAVTVGALADGLKAPDLARLIDRLGDRDYHVREAASKKLEQAGEAALPALADATHSPIPEVAERAIGIVARIHRRLANEKALAGTMVHLDGGKQTLGELFAAIEKQSRYKLQLNGDQAGLTTPVTTKAGTVPFWEAVQRACDAAELTVERASTIGGPTIQLRAGVQNERAAGGEQLAMFGKARDQRREQVKQIQARMEKAEGDEKKKQLAAQIEGEKQQISSLDQAIAVLEKQYGLEWQSATPIGTVVLQTRASKGRIPACVTGAVRLVAEPVTEIVSQQYPKSHLPLAVKVYPEPRMAFQGITETVILEATDPACRDLSPTYFNPRTTSVLANDELQFRRAQLGLREGQALPTAMSTTGTASVFAPTDGPPVTTLKSVRGFLRAKVWTVPGEVAVVRKLNADGSGTADGPNGVRLSVMILNPAATGFDATIRYSVADLRMESAELSEAGNSYGVFAHDAAGKLVRTAVVSMTGFQEAAGGRVRTVNQIRFRVVPPKDGETPNVAAVSFRASRLADVTIPFKFTDVPVSAGTR